MGHPGAETEPSGPDDEGPGFSFCTVKPEDILAEGLWSNPLQVQRHKIEEAEIGTPPHLGPQLRVRLVIRRVRAMPPGSLPTVHPGACAQPHELGPVRRRSSETTDYDEVRDVSVMMHDR